MEYDKEFSWERKGSSPIFGGDPTATHSDEYQVKYRLSFLEGVPVTSGTTLDLGCGFGVYIAGLPNAVGLEVEERFVRNRRAELVQGVAERIPIRSDSCGMVYLIEVIEHVNSEAETLQEVKRVLAAGGHLFVTVPNRFYPFETHGFQLNGKTIGLPTGIPFLSFCPRLIRKHIERARIYSLKEIVKLLQDNGFRIIKTGFMPPPLDALGQTSLVMAMRKVVNAACRFPPFKQMGVSCMVIAER